MTIADVYSKADFVVDLLYAVALTFRCEALCWLLFCNVFCSAISFSAIIFLRKRELVDLLKLCPCCYVDVCVLRLFHVVPWAGWWSNLYQHHLRCC